LGGNVRIRWKKRTIPAQSPPRQPNRFWAKKGAQRARMGSLGKKGFQGIINQNSLPPWGLRNPGKERSALSGKENTPGVEKRWQKGKQHWGDIGNIRGAAERKAVLLVQSEATATPARTLQTPMSITGKEGGSRETFREKCCREGGVGELCKENVPNCQKEQRILQKGRANYKWFPHKSKGTRGSKKERNLRPRSKKLRERERKLTSTTKKTPGGRGLVAKSKTDPEPRE